MNRRSKILYFVSAVSLISFAVIRLLLSAWIPFLWIPLALAVFGLLGGLHYDRGVLIEFFKLKTTKQGMSMGGMILLVVVFLVAVNFLGARNYKTFDFSPSKVNTLSDLSVKMVQSLDSELRVIYFYQKGVEGVEENKRAFIDLVKKYQDHSSKIKLEFAEVNQRPDLVEEFGVTQGSGLVFLDYKGRRNRLDKIDEQEMTSALVKVTREESKTVYFLIGHGERDIEDAKEADGFNGFKKMLEGNRYEVKPLSLISTGQVPTDADLLVVGGARQRLIDNEIKAIRDYLARGGSLLVGLEPKWVTGLEDLLAEVGIAIQNNYVVQVMNTPLGKAINPNATPASDFSTDSPITKPFPRGQFVLFRLPTAITKTKNIEGLKFIEVAKTPASSMSFTDLNFSEGGAEGPFALAVTVEGKWPGSTNSKEFRLAVFGDSEFMGNQLLFQNLNRDLALNTVATLVREENITAIAPREVGKTEMTLTPTAFRVFIFVFAIPLPVAFIILSGTLWYRRRYA